MGLVTIQRQTEPSASLSEASHSGENLHFAFAAYHG
ncbi:MAG: hypothetical protein RIS76_4627 [Verrucomicrobiota bacterium]